MSGLVSFGAYSFSNLGKFNYNFSDQKSVLVKRPGMDGGFDMYGDDPAPAPPGKVTQEIMVISADRDGMDALRDAVRLMGSYGLAKLTYQPTESTDDVRWTLARLEKVKMSQDKGRHSDVWQKVMLTFMCPEPVWLVDSYINWTLDDGHTFEELEDGGYTIGGNTYEINAFGTSTEDTISFSGNTKYLPMVTIAPGAGQSCKNPTIQRLNGPVVVDEVDYTGTLNTGDLLVIDGRSRRITVNGSSVWSSVSWMHQDFLRFLPGDNDIRVLLEDSGGAAPTTAYDASINDLDGTHNDVVVADGKGTYDGSTSYTNIYSAALNTFFDGALGSVIARCKVSGAGVWSDGTARYVLTLRADGDNQVFIQKSTTTDKFQLCYEAANTPSVINVTSYSPTAWFVPGITWNKSSDRVRGFIDGSQQGSDVTSLGVWAGSLASDASAIGAISTTPSGVWDGDIYDVIFANEEASIAQMATLNTELVAGTLQPSDLDTVFGVGNWAWWKLDEDTQAAVVSFSYRDSYR